VSTSERNAVRGEGGEESGAPPAAGSGAGRIARAGGGELVSALAALALAALTFGTEWYGVDGVPDPSYARPALSRAEDGWNALSLGRWLILATILVTLGSLLLHATQRRHGAATDTGRLVTVFGGLTSAMLIWRVLISLPGTEVTDQKLGAVLALGCALAILFGGVESVRAVGARRGTVIHRSNPQGRRVSRRTKR
jgi:hypothetical protein